MSKLHIALLQILPGETREENLETGINACRKAKEMGRISPCFRKCSAAVTGFHAATMSKRDSIPSDNAFVNAFGDLAKELDMAIAITYLEQWDPLPRNTLSSLTEEGKGF